MLEKHVQRQLTKVVEDPEKGKYAEYVLLVLGGTKKGDALKEVFPERYAIAIERASGNPKLHAGNIRKEVQLVERTKVCKELYEQSHKTWWIQFLEKKNNLYENLYGMAMDTSVIPRDRIAASKVLFEHMPVFEEEKKIQVEVKITKDEFAEKLREKQLELHRVANKLQEEYIDVEPELGIEESE